MALANDQYEVLDEHGHKTGKVLSLDVIHAQELWHEAVNAWIVNNKGDILMQLRAPGVELSPNVWDVTVGTHLRLKEDPVDAALRGAKSELGLTLAAEDLKHLFNIQCANPMPNGTTHKVVGHVFLIQRDVTDTELNFDKKKIARLAWVPLTQLMSEVGATGTKAKYFPRANNYYPQLFEALQAWM